jgi:nucleoid-associated protein YgaU
MNLKKILKTIKLHENQISMVLGVLILIIAGFLIIRYVKNLKNETPQENTETTQSQVTHEVKKGETLWSISQTYYQKGSDWKKIADANNITDSKKIEIGQKLIIPDISETPVANDNTEIAQTSSPTPKPQITDEAAATSSAINGSSYTVEKGDSLWKIAVRAYGDGYKWVDIAKENHLKNPNIIHQGNIFTIPR